MAEATITPGDDGPYHVQGDFVLIDGAGNRLEITDDAWLCRCGETTNAPFCVGVHRDCEFVDSSRVSK